MQLLESGQMYLETIYVLTRNSSSVRAIDVGEHMGFSKPSVSRALGLLKKGGLVTVDKNGFLSLTDEGLETAEKIYERHTIMTKLLVHLGVDKDTASEDACKLEHAISDGGGGAGLAVGFLHVDQRGVGAVDALVLPQRQHLILPGGEDHSHGGVVAAGDVLELDGGGGEPGVAAGPLGVGVIVAAVEGPAVVEQARHRILQAADPC